MGNRFTPLVVISLCCVISLVAAGCLLNSGRRYEEVVKAFKPCEKTQELNTEARKAGAVLIHEGTTPKRQTVSRAPAD